MALLLTQSRNMMVSRAASPRVVAFSSVRSPLVPTRATPMVSRPQTISSGSAFMGGSSFGGSSMIRVAPVRRGALQVVANAKKSLGCTKEGTNRKAANTSGFRARMATHNGRKILKKRRAKGRHVLCRISMASAQGKK